MYENIWFDLEVKCVKILLKTENIAAVVGLEEAEKPVVFCVFKWFKHILLQQLPIVINFLWNKHWNSHFHSQIHSLFISHTLLWCIGQELKRMSKELLRIILLLVVLRPNWMKMWESLWFNIVDLVENCLNFLKNLVCFVRIPCLEIMFSLLMDYCWLMRNLVTFCIEHSWTVWIFFLRVVSFLLISSKNLICWSSPFIRSATLRTISRRMNSSILSSNSFTNP